MKQYFSNDHTTDDYKIIKVELDNMKMEFKTNSGVFARGGIDFASKLLVENMDINDGDKVLDLGCGYGFIGVYLAKKFNIDLTMIDISERAIELSKMNAESNKIKADIKLADSVKSADMQFDHILLNPPIHAGKTKIYELFSDSYKALKEGGKFTIVMNKKHGAKTAITQLEKDFKKTELIIRSKGFQVLQFTK